MFSERSKVSETSHYMVTACVIFHKELKFTCKYWQVPTVVIFEIGFIVLFSLVNQRINRLEKLHIAAFLLYYDIYVP